MNVSNNINPDTCAKISKGMTIQEVNSMIGGSWGPWFKGRVVFITSGAIEPPMLFDGTKLDRAGLRIVYPEVKGRPNSWHEARGWIGDKYGIWVAFSKSGKVIDTAAIHPVHGDSDFEPPAAPNRFFIKSPAKITGQ